MLVNIPCIEHMGDQHSYGELQCLGTWAMASMASMAFCICHHVRKCQREGTSINYHDIYIYIYNIYIYIYQLYIYVYIYIYTYIYISIFQQSQPQKKQQKTTHPCHQTIWRFPIHRATPKSSISIGLSIINVYKPSILGYPHSLNSWKLPFFPGL